MKRFYKDVAVEAAGGGYIILLDGRSVKTPQRAELLVPSKAVADAVAAEWQAQGDEVNPPEMPMMRYAATTIDQIGSSRAEIIDIVSAFGGHDMLCYRADDDHLAALQKERWQPLLGWAATAMGVELEVTTGIVSVDQSDQALATLKTRVSESNDGELAALHVMTSLTGSLIIALALVSGEIDLETAWETATLDEAEQIKKWGLDYEAEERLSNMRTELTAAFGYLTLCQD